MKLNNYFFFNNFFGIFFFKIFGKIYFVNQKKIKDYECIHDNTHAKDYYNLNSKSSVLAEKYYSIIHGDKLNKYRNSYLKKYASKILPLLIIDNFFNNNFKNDYLSRKLNFYVYKKNISLKVFNDLQKYNLLDLKFKIHILIKIYLKIFEFLKKIYFFLNIFNLEYSLFRNFFSKKKLQKSNFLAVYYLEPEQLFTDPGINPDFIFENNAILKDQIIFACDTSNKKWLSKLKNNDNYNLINLSSIYSEFKFKELFSQYLKYFTKRFSYLSNIEFINLFNFEYKFNLLCRLIKFDFILNSMIVNREIETLKKEHNKKNIFFYFSSHVSPSSNPTENIHTPIDYTFLNFDYLFSTKNMFNFFNNRFNEIKSYKKIGLLSTINVNKVDFVKLEKLLKSEASKKIISVFDNSVGPQTWYSENDYLNLISFIEKLSSNSEYKIIFKTKIDINNFKHKNLNEDIYIRLNKLIKNENILYANEHKLTTVNIIRRSDICIACPQSTVIFECAYFNKPIFGFDPSLSLVEISKELGLEYFQDIDDFNKNISKKITTSNIVNKKINEIIDAKNYILDDLINDLKNILKNKNV